MKRIVNIGLIGLFLLMSITFTFGNDKDCWGQLPSERYLEKNINGVFNPDITINYIDAQESSSGKDIARINPNDDDNTVGGRFVPIGEHLTLLTLLSLTYLICKLREKMCFAKRYRIFK